MKETLRGAALLLTAVFLTGAALSPAQALRGEDGPPPPASPAPTESAGPGEGGERGTPVGSWNDLQAWVEDGHSGAILLTGDIVIPAGQESSIDGNGATGSIDCAGHTIYVEGGLAWQDPFLTIRGTGGDSGLLHVREGGDLALSWLTMEAEEGYAVVQEEGGVLSARFGDVPDLNLGIVVLRGGEVRFGREPILVEAPGPKNLTVAVPEGEPFRPGLLPESSPVSVLLNGGTLKARPGTHYPTAIQQSVTWDISDPEIAASLTARERTVVPGRFTGPLAVEGLEDAHYRQSYQPEALVVFPVDGAVILECSVAQGGRGSIFKVSFALDPDLEQYYFMRSLDQGNSWEEVDEEDILMFQYRMDSEDEEAWFLVEARYPDPSPEDPDAVRLVHTDVVSPKGMEVSGVRWSDGHRGGGEDITGGDPPPPDVTQVPEATPGPSPSATPAATPEPTPDWGDGGWDGDGPEDGPVRPTPRPVSTPRPLSTSEPSAVVVLVPKPTPSAGPTPVPTAPVTPVAAPEPTPAASPEQAPDASAPDFGSAQWEPDPGEGAPPAPDAEASKPPEQNAAPGAARLPAPSAAAEETAPAPSALPAEQDTASSAAPDSPDSPDSAGPGGSGLTPAAQVALGCGAVALLGGGAAAVLDPGLVKVLLRRLFGK